MEQWQVEALQKLLDETMVSEVEPGQRVYTSSTAYGPERYHLLDKLHNSMQIEQLEVDEKWSKRVTFYSDEVPFVLKALLVWHLEDVRKRQEALSSDGDAGDLDDQPF
jgi:hypothetical protein